MNTSQTHRGFTLIELLVVISIISLLVSLLLPSLQKARQLTQAAICLSNAKQIAFAFHLYSGDEKDKFPPLNFYMTTNQTLPDGTTWPGSPTLQQMQWYTNRLANHLPVTGWSDPANAGAMRSGAPDLSSKVWVCPSMPPELWRNTGGGGYGVAENIIRYYPKGGAYGPADIKRAAAVFLIGDVWFPTNSAQPFCSWLSTHPSPKLNPYTHDVWGVSPGVPTPAPRHPNDTVNVAFYDGHASPVSYTNLEDNVDEVFSPDK